MPVSWKNQIYEGNGFCDYEGYGDFFGGASKTMKRQRKRANKKVNVSQQMQTLINQIEQDIKKDAPTQYNPRALRNCYNREYGKDFTSWHPNWRGFLEHAKKDPSICAEEKLNSLAQKKIRASRSAKNRKKKEKTAHKYTLESLKKNPMYKMVKSRSTMNKAELLIALAELGAFKK